MTIGRIDFKVTVSNSNSFERNVSLIYDQNKYSEAEAMDIIYKYDDCCYDNNKIPKNEDFFFLPTSKADLINKWFIAKDPILDFFEKHTPNESLDDDLEK